MPSERVHTWYTVRELATMLHRTPRTVRRLLRPYRVHCRLVRDGKNPRLVLWIPDRIAAAIQRTVTGSPSSKIRLSH